MTRKRTTIIRWTLAACLAAAAASALAQVRARVVLGNAAPGTGQPPPGASLDTDPDAAGLLRKADEYLADKKYREACLVFQHIIDTAGNVMTSSDDRHFLPLRHQVEVALAALPPEALAVYRQTADGEAQALLAAARGAQEETALAVVVRRYFLSSVGAQAAYRLGCLRMDQCDFSGARVLFQAVLTHPDAPADRADLLAHLAYASARAHDAPGAHAALAALEQLPAATLPEALRQDIRRQAALAGEAASGPVADGSWSMSYGGPARDRSMPDLPADLVRTASVLSRVMEFHLDPGPPDASAAPPNRSAVLNRWDRGLWFPAGQLAIACYPDLPFTDPAGRHRRSQEQLYLRGPYTNPITREHVLGTVCVDAETGALIWPGDQPPAVNAGANPAVPGGMVFNGPNMPDNDPALAPNTPEEVLYFADRVNASIAVFDGLAFSLEGPAANATTMNPRWRMMRGLPPQADFGGNTLAAWDARNGKVRWRFAAADAQPPALPAPAPAAGPAAMVPRPGPAPAETPAEARFLAAPVPCGDLLLLPLEEGDSQYLVALRRAPADAHGNEAGPVCTWKTFLCAGPTSGAARYAPVGLAADGNDVYVASGRGVVFALDAADGALRWASRYDRREGGAGDPRFNGRWMGNSLSGRRAADATGWDEDLAIVRGGTLLVMPSDSPQIWVFDTRNGQSLTPMIQADEPGRQFRYCLGVTGEGLFIAGPNRVRKYQLPSYKLAWEYPAPGSAAPGPGPEAARSFGRGLLTPHAVYLPTREGILRLDPVTGKPTGTVHATASAGEPLGNLYTDGTRVFGLGFGRLCALMEADQRLLALQTRIAAGDREARVVRARLYRDLGRTAPAIDDLHTVLAEQPPAEDPALRQEARALLLDALVAQALTHPADASSDLTEASALAADAPERARVTLARGACAAATGHVPEAVDFYLRVAGDTLVNVDGAPPAAADGAAWGPARCAATRLAAAALQQLASSQPQWVGPVLNRQARAACDQALATHSVESLLAVVRAYPGTRPAIEAGLAAARLARTSSQYGLEGAEQILGQLMRSPDASAAASGLAALAEMYQQAADEDLHAAHPRLQQFQRQAAMLWQRLAAQFPAVPVVSGEQTIDGRTRAAAALARIPAEAVAPDPNRGCLPDPPWKMLWRDEAGPTQSCILATDEGEPSAFLDGHLLLCPRNAQTLGCRDRWTGILLWKLDLPSAGHTHGLALGPSLQGGSILRDGHVGILWTDQMIYGYGLIGGKKLWEAKIPGAPAPAAPEVVATPDDGDQPQIQQVQAAQPTLDGQSSSVSGWGRVSAGSGVVAVSALEPQTSYHLVAALDSATGQTLWTRIFERESIDGVRVVNGYVVVLADGFRQAIVLDRGTGAALGRWPLDPPGRDPSGPPLAVTDRGLICHNAGGLALRALPDGKTLWTSSVVSAPVRCLSQDPATLLLLEASMNNVSALDAATGALRWQKGANDTIQTYADLALNPLTREVGLTGSSSRGESVLLAVDLATGKLRGRVNFGPQRNPQFSARSLTQCADLVPALSVDPHHPNVVTVTFYHKIGKTPQEMGASAPVKLPTPRSDGTFASDPAMVPMVEGGTLIVGSQEGLMVFGRPPASSSPIRPAPEP